ncbi:hypothetical protein [Alicyclobacillus mengziensis]|uniref:Uncharacterized protein n=1 Tax=Alicyclobacillus mengziensis TaxID=2931921 RepID=A0A9X7Z6B1_9BACL|nr:hypothetical protein [Alicyclobacillus mengziensis]QSO46053.1 hypothetical protein JZ786_16160 [Alicyclobacillus mengziensis]
MKLDTVIKLGSLAFGVAQDDRLRELLKIAHHGAKRRGFFDVGPIVPPPGPHTPYGVPGYRNGRGRSAR